MAPQTGVPVFSIHGSSDTTVPVTNLRPWKYYSSQAEMFVVRTFALESAICQYKTQRLHAQANVSLSGDGYYYTTTATIFASWKKSNGCSGGMTVYKCPYSGTDKLWCEGFQDCDGGDVIRCTWKGLCGV